jgi:hypothetical protein
MRFFGGVLLAMGLAVAAQAQGPGFVFVQNGATSSVQRFTLGSGAQSATLLYRPGAPVNGTPMSTPGSANGLAYDNANGRFFLRDGPGNGGGNLFVWDQATQTQRQVTPAAGFGALPGLTGNAAMFHGNYWYVGLNTDTMVRVSFDFSIPTAPTYSFTTFTNFDGTAANDFFAADLAISQNGMLLGGGSSTANPGFRININSGAPSAATFVNLGATANNQLAYSVNGTALYGIAFGSTTINSIDPITGVATAVGTLTLASGTSGNITDMAGSSFAAPEPGTLLLLALGALFLYAGPPRVASSSRAAFSRVSGRLQ